MLNAETSRPTGNSVVDRLLPKNNVKLVLFDLDGTLIDSVGDLAWCGNEMLRLLEMPLRDPEAARAWVGNGVERFVKRVLTDDMEDEPDEILFSKGFKIFDELYQEHVSVRSQVYPGVRECLERLEQFDLRLACVTNKAERFTLKLLAALDLDRYFELIVSGDTTPRKKPDPMPLQFAANHFSLDCRDCLMVGDSSNDVAAARAADFQVACVPYGYNHGKPIIDSDPDLVVENLIELVDLIGGDR